VSLEKIRNTFSESCSNASLLKQISQQIKALDSQIPSTSCIDKTCSQIQQDSSSVSEDEENKSESEEDTLNVITKTFEDEQNLELNKINYSCPTPPDRHYEDSVNVITTTKL